MPNDKFPGNDGLTKEFFETFWSEVKKHFYHIFYTLLVKRRSVPHKIRHSTLCNTYENGGIKSVDIPNKLSSLQCSWIKRLYDTTTHCWKIIPAFFIKKKYGKTLSFT